MLWKKNTIFLQDIHVAGSPELAGLSAILPAWVANYSARFGLSFLLTEVAILKEQSVQTA